MGSITFNGWGDLRIHYYTIMRNLKLTSYLSACAVLSLLFASSVIAQSGGERKFVHPNDVILPIVRYDSNAPVRNPFKSGMPGGAVQDGMPPLERYELKAYKLTAVVNDQQGSFRGNLVDPSGMGHLAVVGTKVGKNGGEVTIAEKNRLVVTEKYTDASGKEQVNTYEYKLGR